MSEPTEPEAASEVVDSGPSSSVRSHRVVRLVIAAAFLLEIATNVGLTLKRYDAQRLRPVFFDLTKTANVVSLLASLPIVVVLVLSFARARRLDRGRAIAIVSFAAIPLILLLVAQEVSNAVPIVPQFGYVAFIIARVLEFSVIVELVRPQLLRPVWRQGLTVLTRAIALGLGSFLMVMGSVLFSPFGGSIEQEPRGAYDAGVILGAAVWSGDRPSPVLRERINTGYDLYRNGTIQFLVLTGSNAPHELPEAEVALRELVARGVDPTRIVVETHTSSTLEQILFLRDQIKRRQGWDSFIVISDQFHLKRALEICRFNGIDAIGVSSDSPLGPQNLVFYHIRESAALALYWLFGI